MIRFSTDPKPLKSEIADSKRIYDLLFPEDHELRKVKENIDFTFLREEVQSLYHKTLGRPALDPALFGKISFLQYRYNLSDREVIQACQNRLDFKFFLDLKVEDPSPCDDTTLSVTRTLWGEEKMKAYFEGILRQAKEKGLYKGKRVFVDSAKVVANAAVLTAVQLVRRLTEKALESLKAACSKEDLAFLQAEQEALQKDTSWWLSSDLKAAYLGRYLQQGQRLLEKIEEVLANPGEAGHLANWEKVRERLELMAGLLRKRLEDEQPKKRGQKKDRLFSPTDKEARIKADSKGKVQAGYKVHEMIDFESELILGLVTTPMNVEDGTQLLGLVNQYREREGEVPEAVVGDSAYADGANLRGLEEAKIEAFIPEPKAKGREGGKFCAQDFAYDGEAHTVRCPALEVSERGKDRPEQKGWYFYFSKEVCGGCPLKEKCLTEKEIAQGVRRGKSVYINYYRVEHDKAKEKQESEAYKEAMKERLAMEHKLAEELVRHGLRRARYRGRWKVGIQAFLTAIAVNLKRIVKLLLRGEGRFQGSVCLGG